MSEVSSSKTKPKKMIGRNIAVSLLTICIILVVGFSGAMVYYGMAIKDKDKIITDLTIEKNRLQTWLDENKTLLNETIAWLNGNVTYFMGQLNRYQYPLLGMNNLTVIDNRTNSDRPHLHVMGTVYNYGLKTAGFQGIVAITFEVRAYQADGSSAIQLPNATNILNIGVQSSINVDFDFPYNGTALTSWMIGTDFIVVI